jgi:hypothetical protein
MAPSDRTPAAFHQKVTTAAANGFLSTVSLLFVISSLFFFIGQ